MRKRKYKFVVVISMGSMGTAIMTTVLTRLRVPLDGFV